MLCQTQQCLPEFSCRVQLCPYQIKSPQPKQDRNQLWCLTRLLTQGVGLGVGVLHLGRCEPFRHLHGSTKGDVQGHGVLGPRRRLWQELQQLDPGGEVADSLQVGRAVAGLVTCALPVAKGLLDEPSLGIIMYYPQSG